MVITTFPSGIGLLTVFGSGVVAGFRVAVLPDGFGAVLTDFEIEGLGFGDGFETDFGGVFVAVFEDDAGFVEELREVPVLLPRS